MKYSPKLAAAMLAGSVLLAVAARAQPARIIILRHGEKLDDYALCDMGTSRAQALTAQYLGRGASRSLFDGGVGPAAIFVMTAHTLDTASPIAESWGMPVIDYSVVPAKGGKNAQENLEENQRTREAAHDIMTNRQYAGKTVVIIWEHDRIANAKLEADNQGQAVTFRQLLHLDRLAGVPTKWSDSNYNFIWVVDFAPGQPVPTKFTEIREAFGSPFDGLPNNDWNTPEPKHVAAGCIK